MKLFFRLFGSYYGTGFCIKENGTNVEYTNECSRLLTGGLAFPGSHGGFNLKSENLPNWNTNITESRPKSKFFSLLIYAGYPA